MHSLFLGGAAAVASHYAQAAAAASTGAVEFSRGGGLPQGGQGDPKMMRMGSGAVGGRPSYVMTSSSAAGVSRGAPPISHPPISTVASAGIPSRQPPQVSNYLCHYSGFFCAKSIQLLAKKMRDKRQFWRFENKFQHFENEFQLFENEFYYSLETYFFIFGRMSLI